jgi:hypothetical protein
MLLCCGQVLVVVDAEQGIGTSPSQAIKDLSCRTPKHIFCIGSLSLCLNGDTVQVFEDQV